MPRTFLVLANLFFAKYVWALPPCIASTFSAILPSTASILGAYPIPQNGTFGQKYDIAYPTNATNLPALCAVIVNVTSSPTSSFTFGLFLPNQWQGRMVTVGNGGFSGGINWESMGGVVGYGGVVMSTGTGHNSSNQDMDWALGNEEAKLDWAWRAMHGSVVVSKDITQTYYNSSITYSYYVGCSTGGRQGLKAIQRFPEDFDGTVMGAPAWWSTRQQLWQLQVGIINLPEESSHYIPPSLFPMISAEVIRQCDSSDGIRDGIIMDPKRCNFYPDALLCTPATTNLSACLTAPQINTLNRLHQPIVFGNDTFIYPSFGLGSESQMAASFGTNNTPSLYGTEYVQKYILADPSWDWRNFSQATIELADREDPGAVNAIDFDLGPYRARGGKLIHYHGLADGLIPTGASELLYRNILYNMSAQGIGLDEWYRFFEIPGMHHCSQAVGNAPWYIGGQQTPNGLHSVPGFSDPQHDIMLAIIDWTEHDAAPSHLIATKFANDETLDGGVVAQRPLCPYPGTAVYVGGAVMLSTSWSCVGPGVGVGVEQY